MQRNDAGSFIRQVYVMVSAEKKFREIQFALKYVSSFSTDTNCTKIGFQGMRKWSE